MSYLISDGTHKTPKYVSNGIPFISVKDISSGILNFENTKYITEEEHLQLTKRCKPEKDDLLICRIGTLGKAIKINVDNEFSIFVSLGLIKLLNKEIADYLVYVINSVYGFNWIEKNKVGGGTHTFKINLEDLKEMLLPLPPASEQNKIVEKTNYYIPYISKYEIVYKKLENLNNSYKEELKKSILQYAIQGKLVPQNTDEESADVLINKILDEKRELIKTKQIKKENLSVIYKGDTDNQFYEKFDDGTIINITNEIPFDIPTNWSWTRLYNVLEIARGGSPRPIQAFLTEADDGINWIKIGDTEKGGKYINSTKEKIIPEGMKKSRFVKKGDFILSNSMSFGRPYILNIDGCIHDGWLVFSNVDTCFFKDYLYYLLSSNFVYSQFCSRVSGAVVNNLNSDKVKSTLIPLPPQEEQKRIASSLESLFNILADT